MAPPAEWQKVSLDPRSHPTNDWRLLDLFTVSPHPNADRGQLSINQSELAAWSAVLSGVTIISNLPPAPAPVYTTNIIQPSSPQLLAIVNGINRTRAQQPGQVFQSLGELLSVPELTVGVRSNQVVHSPYLGFNDVTDQLFGMDDNAYEWIPQQVLSLLKAGEARFVVYAFGQSLKPADRSIVTSSPFFGICTNYQVTGEVYTRSVVRVEGTARRPKPVVESFNILPTD